MRLDGMRGVAENRGENDVLREGEAPGSRRRREREREGGRSLPDIPPTPTTGKAIVRNDPSEAPAHCLLGAVTLLYPDRGDDFQEAEFSHGLCSS